MTQRAAAHKKRASTNFSLNPVIQQSNYSPAYNLHLIKVSYLRMLILLYPHTGVHAIKSFSLK
jgi:hypothetical protein